MTLSNEKNVFALIIRDGIPLVKISAKYLDLTFADDLSKTLIESENIKRGTVVDFATVTYIDSVIISTIVKHFVDQRKTGHRLIIFNTGKHINELLETTRLNNILDVAEDLDEAIEMAKRPLTSDEITMYSRDDETEL